MITRRHFLATASAGTAWSAVAGWKRMPELPLARVGLITDTHIDDNPDSCRFVGEAFRLFRREKVDTILHAGDLATVWSPAGYREYRRLFHQVFAESAPRELFSYGQHDGLNFPRALKEGEKWYDVKWPAFAEAMETDQPYQTVTTLGGFPLIVFPQKWVSGDFDELVGLVGEAARKNPNGPVFVLTHVPIIGTTFGSERFGCGIGDKAKMAKYPNVIMLTGHAHEDLHDEGVVWQEGFTAVALGTLQWPRLICAGRPIKVYRQDNVMTMDVFTDRVEFVRWNLATGSSFGDKWVVHWGLHPEVLGAKSRMARERRGRFPERAKISVASDGNGGCRVRFPEILETMDIRKYEVRAEVAGKTEAIVDVRGPWYARAYEHGEPEAVFRDGLFKSGEKIAFRVVPLTFMGAEGPALATEWVAGKGVVGDLRWEGSVKGEWVSAYPFGFLFHLPQAAWLGKAGSRFRVSVSLTSDAAGELKVYSDGQKRAIGSSLDPLYVVGGSDTNPLRYVIDVTKETDGSTYSLYFANTMARRASLPVVRVERMDDLMQT